ncbi:hypothetical protein LX32DRAFT_634842 [Colletotrichum zoysiae]|uniref:Uncharacterized protein n=1 Tax=Colletotrichum zoysiae TaxID=1216348 RepID=A0AAD9HRK9_9PEZI|nr:hypothetical protein LX32DRAFT_634842 [Colletotrichum zoysiae]
MGLGTISIVHGSGPGKVLFYTIMLASSVHMLPAAGPEFLLTYNNRNGRRDTGYPAGSKSTPRPTAWAFCNEV